MSRNSGREDGRWPLDTTISTGAEPPLHQHYHPDTPLASRSPRDWPWTTVVQAVPGDTAGQDRDQVQKALALYAQCVRDGRAKGGIIVRCLDWRGFTAKKSECETRHDGRSKRGGWWVNWRAEEQCTQWVPSPQLGRGHVPLTSLEVVFASLPQVSLP